MKTPIEQRRNRSKQLLIATVALALACAIFLARADSSPKSSQEHDPRLNNFDVIEFRRYSVKPDDRKHFALYFDTFFPEAFQQLGVLAAGSFLERENPSGFTWIRAFHTTDDRAVANAAFYYGSVWNEHRNTLNALMTDSDNVMLLRPWTPERGIAVLPAVDPVAEPNGAQGVVVAQVFSVRADGVDTLAKTAESTFANYRAIGAREAGVLVTLDVKNNFPQLPIRTDGPYLVWLGILRDNHALEAFTPIAEGSLPTLVGTGLLRGTPELIVLDPTPRSRFRWLPSWK